MVDKNQRACIVGGGLVGSICACFLSQRGYMVELYEMRNDFREDSAAKGRSINMALSQRGLEALERVGLREKVTSLGIPMYARMIHDLNGTTRPIPYGKPGQCIISIDRMKMNKILLNAAIEKFNVEVNFGHKVVSCDPNSGDITFEKLETNEKFSKKYDLIVGCDGAYSSIRRWISRCSRFNFEQKYIEHGYLEIEFPSAPSGDHSMAKNYLHIWPRNEFMMIGLPNLDGTFTGTAFMPFSMFDQLSTEEQVLQFFRDTFPDIVPLIGEQNLTDTLLKMKALPLIYIRCNPYHVADKTLIIGDAAHAMVPFYGQGMNCGFEDCIILDDLLNKYDDDLGAALPAFTEARTADAHAIVDLALYNYIEMRQSVNSIWFLFRKKLDNMLNYIFPNRWIPLYTMVTFTRIRYSQAIADREWQDRILSRLMLTAAGGGLAAAYWLGSRFGWLRSPLKSIAALRLAEAEV